MKCTATELWGHINEYFGINKSFEIKYVLTKLMMLLEKGSTVLNKCTLKCSHTTTPDTSVSERMLIRSYKLIYIRLRHTLLIRYTDAVKNAIHMFVKDIHRSVK